MGSKLGGEFTDPNQSGVPKRFGQPQAFFCFNPLLVVKGMYHWTSCFYFMEEASSGFPKGRQFLHGARAAFTEAPLRGAAAAQSQGGARHRQARGLGCVCLFDNIFFLKHCKVINKNNMFFVFSPSRSLRLVQHGSQDRIALMTLTKK